jgi:hypothetical protein
MKVIISLSTILLISAGIGYILEGFLNGFWRGFIASLICHFLTIVIINSISRKRNAVAQLESILNDMIELQTVKIVCPCGKGSFDQPLFLNKDNVFECNVCGNEFRVDMDYETVLQTNQPSLNNIYDTLQAKKDKEH